MKTIFKLAAIAAAFGLAPAAAQLAGAPAAAAANRAPAGPPAPAGASAAGASGDSDGCAPAAAPPRTAPTPGIGQPDGRSACRTRSPRSARRRSGSTNIILMPTIIDHLAVRAGCCSLWVMFRYRRGANPTPSRNTHNTTLEIVWTLVPVLILVVIAVPSIRLLAPPI